jgi:hypothetical protein
MHLISGYTYCQQYASLWYIHLDKRERISTAEHIEAQNWEYTFVLCRTTVSNTSLTKCHTFMLGILLKEPKELHQNYAHITK